MAAEIPSEKSRFTSTLSRPFSWTKAQPSTACIIFGSKPNRRRDAPSASLYAWGAGPRLSASVLSLIVTHTRRAFSGGILNTNGDSPSPSTLRSGCTGRKRIFANLIRVGIGSRFVQTRRTPLAQQELIPNLSRDIAEFLVLNCSQLHIYFTKLARPTALNGLRRRL